MPPLREFFLLDPAITYLNHGSFGACPRPVFEAWQGWQVQMERNPMRFMLQFDELVTPVRRELAKFLGTQPDNLVFVTNATFAMNIIARALKLEPGDEILSTNHEYGAVDRTWDFMCRQTGAKYITQPIDLPAYNHSDVIEAIWAGVTERTKVLSLSHITSPTAMILPVAPLIERAKAAGIITVIDGAHVPGQLDLHLDALGADFYVGNLHKWLFSARGAAFLYAAPAQQALLEPLIVSWGWGNPEPRITAFVDEQQHQGTRDFSAFLSVTAALEFFHAHNWPAIRAECHALASYFRQAMAEWTGLPPLTPDSPDWFGQMVSAPLPPCDLADLQRYLEAERLIIPLVEWQNRPFIRISVQGYNTRAEVDSLLGALRRYFQGE